VHCTVAVQYCTSSFQAGKSSKIKSPQLQNWTKELKATSENDDFYSLRGKPNSELTTYSIPILRYFFPRPPMSHFLFHYFNYFFLPQMQQKKLGPPKGNFNGEKIKLGR
jgi:hypothetical protein